MVDKKIRISLIAGDETATRQVQRLNAEIGKSERAFKETSQAAAQAERAAKEVGDAIRDIPDKKVIEVESGGRGSFGKDEIGDLSTFSGAISSVTGALDEGSSAALGFAGDFAGALEYIPAASSALTGFLSSLNPVTAVLAGVAVGVTAFVGSMLNAQQQMDRAIAANIQANADIERRIAEGLDTEQARAEIERLSKAREAELQIVQREIDARARASQAAEAQFGVLSGAVMGFINATSEAEEKSAEVQREAEAAAAQYAAEITRLQRAMESGELASNDAAVATEAASEAERELANERQQAANIAAANAANAIRAVSSALASGLDTAGLEAKINELNQQLRIEEEVRIRLAAAGQQNTAEFAASELRTAALTATLQEYQSAAVQSAAATTTAANAQKALAQNALSFIGGLGSALTTGIKSAVGGISDFAKAVGDYQKQQDEVNKRIADINKRASQQIVDAQRRAAEAAVRASQEIADAQAAYQRDAYRREREHQQRMDSLRQDFADDREMAILNQDTAALDAAERAFKRSKQAARQDIRDERADAAEDLDVQLKHIERRRDAEIAAADARVAEIRATTAIEIAEINNTMAVKRQAYAQETQAALQLETVAARIKTIAGSILSGTGSSPVGKLLSGLASAVLPSGSSASTVSSSHSGLANNPYKTQPSGWLPPPPTSTTARNMVFAGGAGSQSSGGVSYSPTVQVHIGSVGDGVSMEQVKATVVEAVNEGMVRTVRGVQMFLQEARRP